MISAVPTSDPDDRQIMLAIGCDSRCREWFSWAADTRIAKETLCERAARPDADVRAFTVETVRELGYDVLEARDGNSAHHGRLDPGVQLIINPFAFEALATRLRSVLDGQDSSRHVN